MSKPQALPVNKLYRACDIQKFEFETTDDLLDLTDVVGQSRALEAIQFGIGIRHHGYNLFALGPTGIGKQALVRRLLQDKAASQAVPQDWCYVNNFKQPHKPKKLGLPKALGGVFSQDMDELIDALTSLIPSVFDGDLYQSKVAILDAALNQRQEQAVEAVREQAKTRGVALFTTPTGFAFAPAQADGSAMSPKEFNKIGEAAQADVRESIDELELVLQRALHQLPLWQRESREKLKVLNGEMATMAVSHVIEDLRDKYADFPDVLEYLLAVEDDVVFNVDDFRQAGDQMRAIAGAGDDEPFSRYRVNVLVDHSQTHGAPVVFEDSTNYQSLIGRSEHRSKMGTLFTNFNLIKAGALHRANGGYLVLDAEQVLRHPYSWEALKRALTAKEIRIDSLEHVMSLVSTESLEPDPIPLDVKVVLVGDRHLYYLLLHEDPEFKELFKVAVDFEEDIHRTDTTDQLYARLVATLCRQQKLKSFDRTAVARVIEHSSRLVEDSTKLSTHMRSMSDLMSEADYWASEQGHEVVTATDVVAAIQAQIRRSSRLMEGLHENVLRDLVLIDTMGGKVGQVNGLSVIEAGDHAFGVPSRITARARIGEGDLIDIEREVDLAGPIHSKGVMILEAYLGAKYAFETPLALSASLAFEQSYGEVEGDSASSAELYALLSAISGAPINQALAVTGAINQFGEVQAIGGVNEKIEGFFDICQARGLRDAQGVIIPVANVDDLMLRADVVAAVERNEFHIYPISHVDEGIVLLTGLELGEADGEGVYPAGTLNGLVSQQLLRFALIRHDFGDKKDDDESDKEDVGAISVDEKSK